MTGAATDVFISYARENRSVARQLAEALGSAGLRVWWDRDLPAGSEFSEVIETQLQSARVVIVLWTADSVRSGFVRDESSRALRAGKLLPVRLEEVDLPLGFGQIHTLDLLDWDGDSEDEAFQNLLIEVRRLQGTTPQPLRDDVAHGGRRRSRRIAFAALALAVLAALGYGGKQAWDEHDAAQRAEQAQQKRREADRHFRAGLTLQFAKEPVLEGALNEYLSTLELQPQHARAHYYLAHVYVQNRQPPDALQQFQFALTATEAPLDNGQRSVAQKEVAALSIDPNEAEPVARADVNPPPPPPPASAVPLPKPEEPRTGTGTITAPAVPRHPVRDAPPEAVATRLASVVDGLFNDNKDQRITATTGLIVDPDALSDAAPLAIAKALAVLRAGGGALPASAASGVVNTLVLLQSAPPGTLVANRASIEALVDAAGAVGETTRQQAAKVAGLLAAAPQRRPVAYLQIANEAQRPLAEALAAKLRSFGYDAPGIELVGSRAPQRTEVRVQGNSERGYARWVGRNVDTITGAAPKFSTLRNAKPKVDTYEIWLARDLCQPGGTMIDGCKPG